MRSQERDCVDSHSRQPKAIVIGKLDCFLIDFYTQTDLEPYGLVDCFHATLSHPLRKCLAHCLGFSRFVACNPKATRQALQRV